MVCSWPALLLGPCWEGSPRAGTRGHLGACAAGMLIGLQLVGLHKA